MKLSELRALLLANGYKTTAEIDRFDVKRVRGEITGVDIMFTDGGLAYLTVPTPQP